MKLMFMSNGISLIIKKLIINGERELNIEVNHMTRKEWHVSHVQHGKILLLFYYRKKRVER